MLLSTFDYQRKRNEMADKFYNLLREYKEFTKSVSPQHQHTVDTHCTKLNDVCAEIQTFKPLTESK